MQSDRDLQASYFGFVETRDDAMMLIEACRRGSLRCIPRRITFSARPAFELSGQVFIYEEKASGIRRWTDGRRWTPSRVLGDFFIYGERSQSPNQAHTAETGDQPVPVGDGSHNLGHRLYGPLARSFHLGPESLVKKTISFKDSGNSDAIWHLVSYYRPVHVLRGPLTTPSTIQGFIPQPWHLPRNWTPHGNSADGHPESESSMFQSTGLLDCWQCTRHDVRAFWALPTNSRHHHANASQEPLSNPGSADSGTMPWSTDVPFDPSPSEYGMGISGNVLMW
ncbi:Global transcription regulator sge1 [Rhinocladiella similis]